MAKRYKLKKNVLFGFGIFLVILIVGFTFGMQKYEEYKYKQTYEYKFMQKGWTKKEANEIEKLYKDHLKDILKMRTNENIIKLAKEKYFLYKHLNDYLEYVKNNEDKSLKDVVAIINVHADNDWYSKDIESDTSLNEKLIVNKFYFIDETYAPEDIVNIPIKYAYDNNRLRQIALDKYKELWDAAYADGIKLIINSSYREYSKQQKIYEDYKSWYGEEKANAQAAKPGHSEHQTGLAIDVFSTDNQLTGTFKDSKGYEWLKNNAYKYGFIERYPEGKEYLTGYDFESWHWRYVGVEAATTIQKEKITYDEYYAYYIEK